MTPETLSVVSTILGAINLLVLLAIAFHGGRWMGRMETKLENIERVRLDKIEERLDRLEHRPRTERLGDQA